MAIIIHTKLVKLRVAVWCARPRMLCAGKVKATDEHEVAMLGIPAVLQRLTGIERTVDASAEHALRCETHARPASRLNIGYRCFRCAVEEEGVDLARMRPHWVDVEFACGDKR